MLSFKPNLPANNTISGRTRPIVKNIVISFKEANKMKPDLKRAEPHFEKLNKTQQEQTSWTETVTNVSPQTLGVF